MFCARGMEVMEWELLLFLLPGFKGKEYDDGLHILVWLESNKQW